MSDTVAVKQILFFKKYLRLSAVRKVLETLLFQAFGSFETLDSKLSHGTSLKFADVRTHLRKVSKNTISVLFLFFQPFFETLRRGLDLDGFKG